MMRFLVLLLLFCLIPLRAYAADPEAEIEKIIGKPLAESFKIQYGVVRDPAVQAWVDRVGASVAAQSPRQDVRYTFTIADTDIVNAFSLPGGYVFVTRGLLQDVTSDDELAGVLGHEVGHETHYDAAKLVAASAALDLLNTQAIKPRTDTGAALLDVADVLLLLSLSRHNEAMADQAGVDFSSRAGYDPNQFLDFFETAGEGNDTGLAALLATHPPDKDRIRRIKIRIAALAPADWHRIGDSLMARNQYVDAATAYTAAGDTALAAEAEQMAQALPAPPAPAAAAPYAPADQQRFMAQIEHARKGLRQASHVDQVTYTLQQILLFEFPTRDVAVILVAAQAYAAEERAEALFSEAAFVTRTSPRDWDMLGSESSAPVGSLAAVNAAQAAGDLASASQQVQGVPGPLKTSEDILLAALLDLDSQATNTGNSTARWTQYGALEAAALTANTSLSQGEKNASAARKSVASAQLRVLEQQLDAYPQSPAYTAIAARQLNIPPAVVDQTAASTLAAGQGGYGTAAVLISLAEEAKADPAALAAERSRNDNESAVDMASSRGASLVSMVITLRMIHLDFERARTPLTPGPSPQGRGVPSGTPTPSSPGSQSSTDQEPPQAPPSQGGANSPQATATATSGPIPGNSN